jgi:hypothetical protein
MNSTSPYRSAALAPYEERPRIGVLRCFWRFLFGDPALPLQKSIEVKPQQCGCPRYADSSNRCPGAADPRCKGGNCSAHCAEHCRRHGSREKC